MKHLLNWILIIFFIALANGCGKIQDPEFRRIGDFKLKKLELTNATIGLNVVYYNPNNFTVSVKEGSADLYIDSVYMGKFTQDNQISVPKSGEFSIPLSGNISLGTALKLNVHDLSNREVLIRANGEIKIGKAGVFITKPVSYQGKHKVDIDLGSLKLNAP